MKKRITTFAAILLVLATVVFAGACSGKMNMLMGRWKLSTEGDQYGQNQQSYPLPVVIDIYPNGTINLLETSFGKWTMDRDTYTFKSDDGSIKTSGSFKLEYITDQNSGGTVPTLTVFMDDQPVSYVLQKQADLGTLESANRAKTAAPVATLAPATPTPTATSAQ
jgi:hypothetical protein